MGLKTKILGHKYDIKVIRRKIRSGSQDKVVEDRAAVVEDDDTGTKNLKFKSDGETVPKPSNINFDHLSSSGFFSKASDFIEVEEDDGTFNFIGFTHDEDEGLKPESTEKEHIFQAYRNFQNKKTLKAWSKEDNTKLYLAGYLTILSIMTVAAIWFIVNGSGEAIAEGVAKGLKQAPNAAGAASGTVGG